MFGELDPEDVDPKQLESKVTKVLRQEAATSEKAAIKNAHGQIPADCVTRIPITMADIPPKFEIPPECIPETENVKEVSAKIQPRKLQNFITPARSANTCHKTKSACSPVPAGV